MKGRVGRKTMAAEISSCSYLVYFIVWRENLSISQETPCEH